MVVVGWMYGMSLGSMQSFGISGCGWGGGVGWIGNLE